MAFILRGNGVVEGLTDLPAGSVAADDLHATLDLSSKTITYGAEKFKKDDGTEIVRPQFMAKATSVAYNHTFQSGDGGSYTSTNSRSAFSPWNVVGGENYTGFTTSSTPGNAYYDIPVTGYYVFSWRNLVNGTGANHIDTTLNITDSATNTYRNVVPWQTQYIGVNGNYDPCGFTRSWDDTNAGGIGQTIIAKFYEGQRIRNQITSPGAWTVGIYGDAHSYWHGLFLGK